jgi:hypothetical protein
VLASCSFDPSQEQEAFAHLQVFKGPELKFSRLRKSPADQRAVLAFLNSSCITSATAAAIVFHKPYMVVTKYCDLVIEPSMREGGVDFYARGANIAATNLLATTMPVFLNPKSWSDFLALFVRVVRERTPALFEEWRRSAELIHSHLQHTEPTLASSFAPLLLMHDADQLFRTLSHDELDPLVPAYCSMAGYWGKSIAGLYELIADESKVLARQRDRLLALSDPNLKSVTIGYDRRKMDLPLQVADITAVDSTSHRQVQFADILAGAIASAAKARAKGPLQAGTFPRQVFEACFAKRIIIDAVWPNHEVDPKDLGTDIKPGPDDVDAATYMAMALKGHPATRKANS